MATSWFGKGKPVALIVPFTLSCVISGCEAGGPHPPAGFLSSPGARAAGAQLFSAHCVVCHGPSGQGNGEHRNFMVPPPGNLTHPPWTQRKHASRTFLAIRNGVPGTAMPSWSTLSDRQIWELVAYIESPGRQH